MGTVATSAATPCSASSERRSAACGLLTWPLPAWSPCTERAGAQAWGPGILGHPVTRRDPTPHNVEPGSWTRHPGDTVAPMGQGADIPATPVRAGSGAQRRLGATELLFRPDLAGFPEAAFVRLVPHAPRPEL